MGHQIKVSFFSNINLIHYKRWRRRNRRRRKRRKRLNIRFFWILIQLWVKFDEPQLTSTEDSVLLILQHDADINRVHTGEPQGWVPKIKHTYNKNHRYKWLLDYSNNELQSNGTFPPRSLMLGEGKATSQSVSLSPRKILGNSQDSSDHLTVQAPDWNPDSDGSMTGGTSPYPGLLVCEHPFTSV